MYFLSTFRNNVILTGEITTRHMQIFRSNQYFRGVNIPEPEDFTDLRQRLHSSVPPLVVDFLTV